MGLALSDRDELVTRWGDVLASDAWVRLLAGLWAVVEEQRGRPDDPVLIVRDLDETGVVGRLLFLYLAGLAASGTRDFLISEGFPSDVIVDTLATVARHAAVHRRQFGTSGLSAGWWIMLALRGDLVNIGSLQYHRLRLGIGTLSPSPWYPPEEADVRGVGFRWGDPVVGLHIPDGADLSEGAVDQSLGQARDLLQRTWPAPHRRLVTCQSWIFDPHLADILGSESRLLRFARRFTLVPGEVVGDHDVREFVLRPHAGGPTRLQESVIRLLDSGRHWSTRTGWMSWESTE